MPSSVRARSTRMLHENLVDLSSTASPKPKGYVTIPLPAQANRITACVTVSLLVPCNYYVYINTYACMYAVDVSICLVLNSSSSLGAGYKRMIF